MSCLRISELPGRPRATERTRGGLLLDVPYNESLSGSISSARLAALTMSDSADSKSDEAPPLRRAGTGKGGRREGKGRREAHGGEVDVPGTAQASECPVFAPPSRTREEELQRVHLIEEGKKTMNPRTVNTQTSLREPVMHYNELGIVTCESPVVPGRRNSVSGAKGRASRSRSTGRPDGGNSTATENLLEILVAEVARMRSTLEHMAQDKEMLEEQRLTNKLLALLLASGHTLEGHESSSFHPLLLKKLKNKKKAMDVILDAI